MPLPLCIPIRVDFRVIRIIYQSLILAYTFIPSGELGNILVDEIVDCTVLWFCFRVGRDDSFY